MASVNRLSDLPEGLICEILSRLEIQEAVQTCVLSKKWTRMWTQIPRINLNYNSFDFLESFQLFLLGLFTHYDAAANLHSLTFVAEDESCSIDYEETDHRLVETIIDYATVNQVKHLSIDCYLISKHLKLPPQLLACLCDLRLEYFSIEFPKPFVSDSLGSIYLNSIYIKNDIELRCGNLQSFTMIDCNVSKFTEFVIHAPKLVKLRIQCEWLDETSKEMMLSVSAPRLEFMWFEFYYVSIINISVDRCPTLKSAWLDIYQDLTIEHTEDVHQEQKRAKHLVKFLKDVSDVRSLTVSASTMKIKDLVQSLLVSFHHITKRL
ncbi:hypothetical protein ACFE04_012654 [Oxalis oulophora]